MALEQTRGRIDKAKGKVCAETTGKTCQRKEGQVTPQPQTLTPASHNCPHCFLLSGIKRISTVFLLSSLPPPFLSRQFSIALASLEITTYTRLPLHSEFFLPPEYRASASGCLHPCPCAPCFLSSFFCGTGIKSRALHMPSKYSTA